MLSRRPRLSPTERLRLFTLHGGICHACGHEIDGKSQRWEIDHVTARGLKARGFACEADTDENMRPAHYRCHKGKTVRDVGLIAKADRIASRFNGARRSSRPMPCGRDDRFKRRIGGRIVLRDEVRP